MYNTRYITKFGYPTWDSGDESRKNKEYKKEKAQHHRICF